jgi:bacterial/archaeal transporter family protein
MNEGIVFAVIGAVSFGLWTVFHQQASAKIDPLLGAIVVSLTAALLGMFMLLPRIKSSIMHEPKGILFALLAGAAALAIDYFALKAYGSGLHISIAGPIIMGGSIAFAALIGFFLGESVTAIKLFGIALVVAGSGILARVSG